MRPTAKDNRFPSLLLVEDNKAQVGEIELLLKPFGNQLRIAGSGRDAIQNVAEDPDIALIIISAKLAGSEACDIVQQLRKSAGRRMLPVLFLTGGDDRDFDLEAVFALDAVDEVPRIRLTWALPAKVRFVLDSDVFAHSHEDRMQAQPVEALDNSLSRQSDFLATVAHELRNSLAPMRSGLELMRLADGDSEEVESVRRMISRQLDHTVHLVEDLLDVTRLTHDKLILKKERVDLRAVIENALDMARPLVEAKQHTLTVELSDEPLPIEADPVRIAQIIINLLNNAAKYTQPGGHIRLTASNKCDEVHVSISDTGIGIPKQALTSIFEMFTQVRQKREPVYDGLGVGLALVQRLLDLHGGSIDAYSAGRGHGSTFRVRLPRSAADILPAKTKRTQGKRPLTGPFRILVVDDNADARSTFSRVLDRQHHVTRQARNGIQALAVAVEFEPDIIFLDIGLPDINGWDLAPQLRKLTRLESVVLVALTGRANTQDHARSAAAGIDHHLNKPTHIQAVYDLLEEIAMSPPRRNTNAVRECGNSILDDLNDCISTPLVALSVSDAQKPDLPLIAANQAFTDLTGYPLDKVIGRNCRFLQGRNREQEGRRLLANAIREGRDCEVFLHNVKRSGESFSNLLRLYTIRDATGVPRYILGSQLEAEPVAQSTCSLAAVTSGTSLAMHAQRLDDSYPAQLPRRYWSLYNSSRRIADSVATRLQERVSRLNNT